jgi:hypothetical protein
LDGAIFVAVMDSRQTHAPETKTIQFRLDHS